MSHVVEPLQELAINAYDIRLHSFNNNERRFVSPDFNKMTRALGQDIILSGLGINNISYNNTDLTVTLNPGRLITDDTYIEIDENSTVIYPNAHVYDSEGYFLIMSHYENNFVSTRNVFQFNFIYMDRNNVPMDFFSKEKNRIVVAAFQISKNSSGYINNITQLNYKDIIGIQYTWEDDTYIDIGTGSREEKLLQPDVQLMNTTYNLSIRIHDQDNPGEGRLKFESKNDKTNSFEAWGNETDNEDWITTTGTFTCPAMDYYNIFAVDVGWVNMTDFKITGKFPFMIGKPFQLEPSLDGGFISD